jgi:hypothetical protein
MFFRKPSLPFEEARELVRASGIESYDEWHLAYKEGRFPKGMPCNPNRSYKGSWIDWSDFLGTGWFPFTEVREFARASRIKTGDEWRLAHKERRLPKGMPSNPNVFYKDLWIDWNDFLGTEWIPFVDAREFARSSDIETSHEWQNLSRDGKLPEGMPSNPAMSYKEWKGWKDFLGTEWIPFEKAREWARASDIRSVLEWMLAHKERRLPEGMPRNPAVFYKGLWNGWEDFLGTGYLPFEEARERARASDIKSAMEWNLASKDGRLPKGMPCNLYKCYERSWKGWEDFLDGRKKRLAACGGSLPSKVWRTICFWKKGDFTYSGAGKDNVTEMMIEQWGRFGYDDLRFLSMPADGRELKRIVQEFNLNYPNCLAVERDCAWTLRRVIEALYRLGEIGGIIPVVKDDVDHLLLRGDARDFNVAHLDYNGPLVIPHVLAAEKALEVPGSIVAVTVSQNERMYNVVNHREGEFPFTKRPHELLFWQPYKGSGGAPMETFCFRSVA